MRTIQVLSIEKPLRSFVVSVRRPQRLDVVLIASEVQLWQVLAETEAGALKVAQWHFYKSSEIEIVRNIVSFAK